MKTWGNLSLRPGFPGFCMVQADALRPVGDDFRIRPTCSGQSLLQVADLGIRDRDGEWMDER